MALPRPPTAMSSPRLPFHPDPEAARNDALRHVQEAEGGCAAGDREEERRRGVGNREAGQSTRWRAQSAVGALETASVDDASRLTNAF
jgi:hypothetical protein